jgi:hypothetical protein
MKRITSLLCGLCVGVAAGHATDFLPLTSVDELTEGDTLLTLNSFNQSNIYI